MTSGPSFRASGLVRALPTPFLKASALLHAAAAGSLVHPPLWPAAVGAVLVNHVGLAAAGLLPRCDWLGPNWTRLPGGQARVAITIDDGPDPAVTPRVLDVLAAHAVRATFFCIGERVARHPDLARAIVAAGHAVENHSQRHLHRFALLGPRSLAREIGAAQDIIREVCGRPPAFFRAPAGLRSPLLQPRLEELGLQLASWTRRGYDTVNPDAGDVLGRLRRNLAAGDILLLHDGHAARTAAGAPVILEVLPALLDEAAARGLACVTLAQARA
ncbi:MAG TPA: polysaccharide deacetylase family protein [Steroidobacteraceae bacterium]|nr:polysaccharide deacetylase family protein [Steroidobacteraceae bacterium]